MAPPRGPDEWARNGAQALPAQTVTDLNGEVLFQVNEDGGLWASGTFGAGRLPAEDAGTRLV